MSEDLIQMLHSWESFYVLSGTAAATLIGLMFVVVTFGANRVNARNVNAMRTFVDPILVHFVSVLLVAGLLLMPLKNTTVPALALLLLGFIRLFGWLRGMLAMLRASEPLDASDWLWYGLLPLLSHALLIGSSLGLWLGWDPSLMGLGTVSLLLLAVGIQNAWDTVIWIALQEATQSEKG